MAELKREFEQWWAKQTGIVGLPTSYKWAAWNGWIAACENEAKKYADARREDEHGEGMER